ncbi:inorganic phosphate transporter [Adhaeribacter pallidiroseus]|uniref:Phosphate transporter n=1 Tax=Adhaeribacter pallidiroseus TaxID=2072847 RepID=A0A369QR04_9BACT|nr:inorganic phosphate transporter [Adhaeribacter pallidiroseus]RDC65667.1 putative low-affinity inorganic phosphate transporter [Adhaeribacter pallidiroseus]
MLGLETHLLLLLFLCLLAACAFEFVNGFHDTANAVATVIYTNTLRPWVAVVWSAFWNFIGVFAGGIGVAMGIVYLLPVEALIDQNIYHGIAMIGALLLSAILWNLGTWYYGLPSSSSHTLIGSILGVGVAFSLLPDNTSGAAVNWDEAIKTGLSLIVSPFLGFTLTVFLMFILKRFVKNKAIFRQPHKRKPPPLWIRLILILTCTLVSFFHGSNDGQKGVGLVMLILIGIVPTFFALDNSRNPLLIQSSLAQVEQTMSRIDTTVLSQADAAVVAKMNNQAKDLHNLFAPVKTIEDLPKKSRFLIRRDILLLARGSEKILTSPGIPLSLSDRDYLKSSISELRSFTDYAPDWVILMIAMSLGCGTMIGWKRIVKTIGEKIGKEHLTYAQGASAELMAAGVIGFSTFIFKLPVSTTHILSSGIAGSMVANKGIRNLNPSTIRNIALAWVLTLPVSMFLAGSLFLIFRWAI